MSKRIEELKQGCENISGCNNNWEDTFCKKGNLCPECKRAIQERKQAEKDFLDKIEMRLITLKQYRDLSHIIYIIRELKELKKELGK